MTREGHDEVSVEVRMAGANEHRKAYHLGRRGCLAVRRQNVIHRNGETDYGPTVSKNSRTCVRILSGPERSPSCPVVAQGCLGKAEDVIA